MESKTINFNFTGHYYVSGDFATASQIWFVLHGYGQLARYFLRNFDPLLQHNIAVGAPEALSHFYLEDTHSRMKSGNDRVGASWMTKEKRLTDIDNYMAFLDRVYQEISSIKKDVPTTVLGFSQGAATASRWVLNGKVYFDRLILWAGILPPDIDFSEGQHRLIGKSTFIVYGDQDPFLNDNRFTEMKSLSEKLGISPTVKTFHGAHQMDGPTLLELI